MAVQSETDPVLSALRADYESKYNECNRIIADPSATGERLGKAEKMSGELSEIQRRIDERTKEVERILRIKSGLGEHERWAREPLRGLPFAASVGGDSSARRYEPEGGGAHHFRVSGSEPAGSIELAFSPQRKLWEMVAEAGPGTFGEAKWGLLASFEYKRDWALYLRKGNRFADLCTKTLMEGMDDQGGVFAPAEFVARIIGRLPAPTSLRALVTT